MNWEMMHPSIRKWKNNQKDRKQEQKKPMEEQEEELLGRRNWRQRKKSMIGWLSTKFK